MLVAELLGGLTSPKSDFLVLATMTSIVDRVRETSSAAVGEGLFEDAYAHGATRGHDDLVKWVLDTTASLQ